MRNFLDDLLDQLAPRANAMGDVDFGAAPTPRPRLYRYTLRDRTVVSVEITSPEPHVRAAALRAVARSLDP